MDDLISRRAAIKAIDDLPNCYNGYSDTYDKAYIIGVLEEAPTIDAVPVVRCKECKYYEAWEKDGDCYCTHFSADPYEYLPMEDDDFCSQGERSEE